MERWTKSDCELETPVEVAYVIALDTRHDHDRKRTQDAWAAIDRVAEGFGSDPHRFGDQRRWNRSVLIKRLNLIQGNDALKEKDWDAGLGHYEEAQHLNLKSMLSLLLKEISLWQ